MTIAETDNVLRSEEGINAAIDIIHHLFVNLRADATEAIRERRPYDAKFIYELSDWIEVLPTYLQRVDADAVDDFRWALQAIAELHPALSHARRRFDAELGITQPLPTRESVETTFNGLHKN